MQNLSETWTAKPEPTASANKKPRKAKAAAAEPKESIPEILIRIGAESFDLWTDQKKRPCASWQRDGHQENARLRSTAFREEIGALLYEETGRGATPTQVETALATLNAMAKAEGGRHTTASRIHATKDAIEVDLCRPDWKAIRITPTGITITESAATHVRFTRRDDLAELPMPDLTAGAAELELLWKYVNVRECDRVLILGWLLQCLQPSAPFCLLNIFGSQGAAKTSSTRALRRILDPNEADVCSLPADERELFISAQGQHILCFENLSFLSAESSDSLCKVATGCGHRKRELFTDDGESILTALNPIILNGITNCVTRGDLTDRSIAVELLPLGKATRLTDAELNADYERDQPKILGGLLQAARHALAGLDSTRKALKGKLPRMADAATFITAGEQAMGFQSGDYLAAYERQQHASKLDSMDGDTVGRAIIEVHSRRKSSAGTWQAPMNEILKDVRNELDWTDRGQKGALSTAKAFAGHLTRISPALEAAGLKVTRLEPRKNDGWHYCIESAGLDGGAIPDET